MAGVPLLKSTDGGETWGTISGVGRALVIDEASNLEPRDSGNVYLPTGTYSIKIKLNGAAEKTKPVVK